MTLKEKLTTVLTVFIILLLLAGFNAFKPQGAGKVPEDKAGKEETAEDKLEKVKHLGGIKTRMPENSALVFFQSTMGRKLYSYTAYGSVDEMLCALRSGKVEAVWACDMTADYLCKMNEDLEVLPIDGMSDIEKNGGHERFGFGMALKDDDKHKKLCQEINAVLENLKSTGKLQELLDTYVNGAEKTEEGKGCNADDMKCRNGKGDTIFVGISGAVPPLELLDRDSEPYGFCVALMDEIGLALGRKVEFEVLDNETIFTSLMSGRIDLVFTYGTGNITTEGKKNYIMTEPYCDMQRYMFIATK